MVLAIAGSTAAATAEPPLIWDLREVRGPAVYEHGFTLTADASVKILAVSGGTPDLPELVTYGWILDARNREVMWSQSIENSNFDREQKEFVADLLVDFPAGDYIAYYAAVDRSFPGEHTLEILGRRIAAWWSRVGDRHRWDEVGSPRRFRFRLAVADPDLDAGAVRPFDPDTPPVGALVHLAPLGDRASERVGFAVPDRTEVEVSGLVEYDDHHEVYVDRAWITNASTGEEVWSVDPGEAWHAGGAAKNHQYRTFLDLDAGTYILHAYTDGSHSFERWNDAPPWDPRSWGVTLRDRGTGDGPELRLVSDPLEDRLVAQIDRVGDASFVRKAFEVLNPIRVRMEGVGEIDPTEKPRYADFGWLERLPDGERIWTMDGQEGVHAGGAYKNRRVTSRLDLDRGIYILAYVTDSSHSYPNWNSGRPDEPDRWGVSIYADQPLDGEMVRTVDVKEVSPEILALAPTGDSTHRTQEITLTRPYRFRVVALGEGVGGRMYDFGWIENADGGTDVWRMSFRDTRHAGGASKNRVADTILDLDPGRYRVHYETDGSHSFEHWNSSRPDHPELWGIVLYRADAGPTLP
jgi:hypothetical protein